LRRPRKLAPENPPLRPAAPSSPASGEQPSPLQIAADTIEKLEAENAKLRTAHTAPDVRIECRLFDELVKTTRHMRRYLRDSMKYQNRLRESELRNRLLQDRCLALQTIIDNKESK
jgi:hypothetical protein